MIALGQFRDTFIIAVDEEGIAIIDQHVAHERVLFERIVERLTAGRLESQRLLEPMLIELPAAARQALAAHAAELERLGFELEEFGGESIRLRLRARRCCAARNARRRFARWPRISRGSTVAQAWTRRSSGSPRRWPVMRP